MTTENQLPLKAEELLRRENRRLRKIILVLVALGVLLLLIYIYNNWRTDTYDFGVRIDDTTSLPNMHNYRRGIHLHKRSMGVYYDSSTIGKYLDTYWPAVLKEQKAYGDSVCKADPSKCRVYRDYKWVIGFYWMMKRGTPSGSKTKKLDFYVIPTLVFKDTVLDYFNDEDNIYYHGNDPKGNGRLLLAPPPPKTGPAYDEGQLFP
jgi:hypothetical protein